VRAAELWGCRAAPGFNRVALIQMNRRMNHQGVAGRDVPGKIFEPSTQAIRGRRQPVIHLPVENQPPPGRKPAQLGVAGRATARSNGLSVPAQLVFEGLGLEGRSPVRHARDWLPSSLALPTRPAGEGLRRAAEVGADFRRKVGGGGTPNPESSSRNGRPEPAPSGPSSMVRASRFFGIRPHQRSSRGSGQPAGHGSPEKGKQQDQQRAPAQQNSG